MKISVVKNKQFPQGVIDLRGLSGNETILMDARLGQELWISGQSTEEPRIFGTMRLAITQGPYGFGIRMSRGVGDVPFFVSTPNMDDPKAYAVEVSELTPQQTLAIVERRRPQGPLEWTPPGWAGA